MACALGSASAHSPRSCCLLEPRTAPWQAVAHSKAAVKNYSQVPGAVEVYRRALAAAPNRSVMIASIGSALVHAATD